MRVIYLISLFLFFIFLLGVIVGKYEIFPYKELKYIEDVLSGDLLAEARTKLEAEARAKLEKAKLEAEAVTKFKVAQAIKKPLDRNKCDDREKIINQDIILYKDKLDFPKNYNFLNALLLDGVVDQLNMDRLPCSVAKSTGNEKLVSLGRFTSGVRLKFFTNTNEMYLKFIIAQRFLDNASNIMTNGLDIYINGKYSRSLYPSNNIIDTKIAISSDSKYHEVEIYFPLYSEVLDYYVGINEFAEIYQNQEIRQKIVYYGSSITQGCCASNPGMSFPAIVSRKIGVDHINLGFSGNGLGEIEIADFINSLSPTIIVLDYWANPDPPIYKETLPLFIQRIRLKHKNVPIIVTSTFANPRREVIQKLKDEISKLIVQTEREKGDSNLYFLDGLLNEDEFDALVDGRHLNSYGFFLVGERLSEFIKVNKLLY